MAITKVRAQFNNSWYTLTYNSTTKRYECKLQPPYTSFNQPGGYYNVKVEATNSAGVVATTDGSTKTALRLVVREEVSPVVVLLSPVSKWVATNKPVIRFQIVDEDHGSGVNLSALSIKIDGTTYTSGYTTTPITRGYEISMTWPVKLIDGVHTLTISGADFDKNPVTYVKVLTVDTTPPELWYDIWPNHSVVDTATFRVRGYVSDLIALPIVVKVTNTEGNVVHVLELDEAGNFDAELPLEICENHLTISATDDAGNSVSKAFYYIRLITDRNEEDIARLDALYVKALSGLTTVEWNEWLLSRERGAYNYTDINRVNIAAKYLIELLYDFGYDIYFHPQLTPDGRSVWRDSDEYLDTHTPIYLQNIRDIRGTLSLPATSPVVPKSIDYDMSIDDANAIEQIMVDCDTLIPGLVSQFFYSDEVFCGEV